MASFKAKPGEKLANAGFTDPAVPAQDPKAVLKKKQRKSIEDAYNEPDPIGDFVRRIVGANKEKKKTGY